MALEKKITCDYEIRTEFRFIQERTRTAVLEDGNEISYTYDRRILTPDADVSAESDELKALANALWTDVIKKAYEDSKEN
tara:strand:+ start:244 stop:483 length:240 start_codon:yes stop_codon:yes gene_type:complete